MTLLKRLQRHRAKVTLYGAAWHAYQVGAFDLGHDIWRMADMVDGNPQMLAKILGFYSRALRGTFAAQL